MAVIISFATQKGGVGKTTSVVNTAHALAYKPLKHRVLVIDLDPQANSSFTLGTQPPHQQPRTVVDVFKRPDLYISAAAVPTKYKQVDLVPSTIDLFQLNESLRTSPDQFLALKNKLDPIAHEKYDYILIDCPPNIGGPSIYNALAVSDFFIIPCEAESLYGLIGVDQFLDAANGIKRSINPKLELLGALITFYDPRTNAAQTMEEMIMNYFTDSKVFKAKIHRSTTINKANIEGKSCIDLDTRLSGAINYREFAKELHNKVQRLKG